MVLAEHLHDVARVHAEQPEQPGQLVGERDLGRVEGVAGVLQDSATRMPVTRSGRRKLHDGHRVGHVRTAVPTTTNGRVEEVVHADALAQERRAHRGADLALVPARSAAGPARPRSSTVPGRDRAADHQAVPAEAGGASRTAAPISSTARRMKDRSVPPRGVDGCPRRRSERSAPASRSSRRTWWPNLLATTAATRSSSPGSATGLWWLMSLTLASSTSTPQTSWPC